MVMQMPSSEQNGHSTGGFDFLTEEDGERPTPGIPLRSTDIPVFGAFAPPRLLRLEFRPGVAELEKNEGVGSCAVVSEYRLPVAEPASERRPMGLFEALKAADGRKLVSVAQPEFGAGMQKPTDVSRSVWYTAKRELRNLLDSVEDWAMLIRSASPYLSTR